MDAKVDETIEWLSAFDLAKHKDVETKARLLLLDTIACAARGFDAPEVGALIADLSKSEPGSVRWPGMRHGLAPSGAAFAGTMAACWYEACEGLARAHGRPGLHAIPPALSFALANDLSLGQLLDAIVWAYELGGRFGEAMRIRPGMHVDGCWGSLASAAAASRISGGGASEVRAAIALAACQIPTPLYLPVRSGSTARNTYAAHAAAMAFYYSSSVRAGCTAPRDAFQEAARFVTGDEKRTQWPWADAGTFLILESYLKPFAAVRHVHYPVQCALLWRALGLPPEEIEGVTIEIYPEAITYCGNRSPKTPIQAQFSLSFGTAYALRHGDLDPAAYDRESLGDPEQMRLEACVRLRADSSIVGRGARLFVRTHHAETVHDVEAVSGDPEHPMARADIAAKASRYLRSALDSDAVAAFLDAVLDGPASQPLRSVVPQSVGR
jgi:2-methylcitrate dehydratase PrpD